MALAQDDGANSQDDYVAPAEADSSNEAVPAEPAAAAAAPAAASAPAAAASTGSAAAAVSAPSGQTTQLGDIAVTGTAIARTDAATSLPVTVVTKEQLDAQGITSASEALQQIPANNSSAGEGLGTGSQITGGANFADLRGLGSKYTLVLLNGRRLSNDAFNGGSVDVNTIPFAAIKRIEVLRDGASALYGTDAVAGVINFITEKDLQGGNLTLQYDQPTNSGGGTKRTLEATFGHGDLDKDGYNLMVTGSYRRQDAVNALDRDFVVIQDESRGVDATSSFPAPANYFQNETPLLNPAGPDCDQPLLYPSGGSSCRFNYSSYGNVVTPSDRASIYARGAYKINDNNQVTLSYLFAHNESRNFAAPGLSSGPFLEMSPDSPYFPGNGITPAPGADSGFDPTQPISLFYRNVAGGGRITKNTNEAHRAMLNFTGSFEKVHYDTAFSFNQGTTDIAYDHGYYNYEELENLVNSTVNPFVSNDELTQAQRNAVLGTTNSGVADSTKAQEYVWDGKLTRELGDWFGAGQLAMAIGAQYRHQRLQDTRNNSFLTDVQNSGGGLSPQDPVDEDRDIESLYSEVNIPVLDSLELNGSFRYDNYSDVGDTVNPKVSLRYQPIQKVVFRGSYSEGFRAPSLYELYNPQSTTFTGPLDDPAYDCSADNPPVGTCNYQFNRLLGGNPDLDSETSKSWTAGLIVSPIERLSVGASFWWIEIDNQVGTLAPSTILDDLGQFGDLITRNENGRITQISTINENLGKVRTNGVDFSINYSIPTDFGTFGFDFQGTLTHKYAFQPRPGVDYSEAVNRYAGSEVIPKWKHEIQLTWVKENWSAQVVNNFSSGYEDADPDTNPEVSDYMTFDASVAYKFDSGIGLSVGSKNIFDRDPPFSNQADYGSGGGYDPRYAEAIGRTVFGRMTYDF
ncbi:TonB-dependent receptor [Salinisphaera sp. Q1T1-3]|nr:TonB-dependent receptor [Salinisphaera sp. Q1T1-3]